MVEVLEVPKILIYEEFDGHPVYRKGYKDFLLGLKTIEEIMGTSTLQWFITNVINKQLFKMLPDNYLLGSGELGLNITKNTNFSIDIAIFRNGVLNIGFHSTKYSKIPPNIVIEIDVKAEESDYFQSEEEYFSKKTEQLLKFGVEKVIWIFSSSRRVLIADNLTNWEFITWNQSIEVMDGFEINIWELMKQNGFQN